MCYRVGDVVKPLRVPVPLDPAEVLHYSVGCFGQTVGIRHHLVHTFKGGITVSFMT